MKTRSFVLVGTILCTAVFIFCATPRPVYATATPGFTVVRAGTQEPVTKVLVPVQSGDAAEIVVSQKGKAFAPGSIEVRVGQPIEIHNDDATVHNAYCQSGDFKYNSGPQQPGTKSRFAFVAPGAYEVRCAIHPKMKLAVTVVE